jgi:hypothetical protein
MNSGHPFSIACEVLPAWFDTASATSAELVGLAVISSPGAATDNRMEVRLQAEHGALLDSEHVPGTRLPTWCPDRHINRDGSFCLGFGAARGVRDRDSGRVWWGLLEQFLKLQRVAGRTGKWPSRQALSHGEAGTYHIRAQELARQLGIENDYLDMLDGAAMWLTSPYIKLDKTGSRLINGRARCPLGCTGRRGRPRLRCECCRRELVLGLVDAEHKRRKAQADFWAWARKGGLACCGTMLGCPLGTMLRPCSRAVEPSA